MTDRSPCTVTFSGFPPVGCIDWSYALSDARYRSMTRIPRQDNVTARHLHTLTGGQFVYMLNSFPQILAIVKDSRNYCVLIPWSIET